jgi:hypothetical protein
MATKTKNKKIIMKAKKIKSVSDIIHEKGEGIFRLSFLPRWEGSIKDNVKKTPIKIKVNKVCGEGEFKGSFGAKADTYTNRISIPPRKINTRR